METSSCDTVDGAVTRKRGVTVSSSREAMQYCRSSPISPRLRKTLQYSKSFSLHPDEKHPKKGSRGIHSVVCRSRRLSEAVARRPSFTKLEVSTGRRSSEPLVTNVFTTALKQQCQHSKRHFSRRSVGSSRKSSSVEALVITQERKLEALALDEILASLRAALPGELKHNDSFDESFSSDSPSSNHLPSIHVDVQEEDEEENIEEEEMLNNYRGNKRWHILNEILKTEQTYVSCLEIINDVFKSPLEDKTIVSPKHLKLIFPASLNEILSLHTLFLEQLDEMLEVNDSSVEIGGVFSSLTTISMGLLDIYTRYMYSFPKSISTLTKYTRGSNKFRKFLEGCYKDPRVERLDLPSFLLSPVQRLPRYILLLAELGKNTDSDHPDKDSINTTKSEMEDIIKYLDKSVKISRELEASSASKPNSVRYLSKKKSRVKSYNGENGRKGESIEEIPKEIELHNSEVRKNSSPEGSRSVVLRRKNKTSTPDRRPVSVDGSCVTNFVSTGLKQQSRRSSWRRSLGSKLSMLFHNNDSTSHSD